MVKRWPETILTRYIPLLKPSIKHDEPVGSMLLIIFPSIENTPLDGRAADDCIGLSYNNPQLRVALASDVTIHECLLLTPSLGWVLEGGAAITLACGRRAPSNGMEDPTLPLWRPALVHRRTPPAVSDLRTKQMT